MTKMFYFLLFCMICLASTDAQTQKIFRVQLTVEVTGNQVKVYQEQIESNLYNELAKITDVRITSSGYDYVLYVSIFQLPCECSSFDYYYRAHFIGKHDTHFDFLDGRFMEGFKNIQQIEELAKDIIATLNVYQLKDLRSN